MQHDSIDKRVGRINWHGICKVKPHDLSKLKNVFADQRYHNSGGVARISRRRGGRGGGFQIGSNENGWSKILTLRTYKTLAFTLRKQKTPWLPLSERVYHFLEICLDGN